MQKSCKKRKKNIKIKSGMRIKTDREDENNSRMDEKPKIK
jgi:hypothetical protein